MDNTSPPDIREGIFEVHNRNHKELRKIIKEIF